MLSLSFLFGWFTMPSHPLARNIAISRRARIRSTPSRVGIFPSRADHPRAEYFPRLHRPLYYSFHNANNELGFHPRRYQSERLRSLS
jgi:hypothetical protein